ncbi:RecX family transcriptional regulator [Betaproteobacteria bacterium]|nr:RecX family transcriptional regulator [Betaproteobacteria bacterium]
MINKKQIYKKAYSLLSKRDYSVAVIRKKLLDFAYTDSTDNFCELIIEDVVEDLKGKNWLSDERVVSTYLNSKGNLYGEKRIWFELKKIGIDDQIIGQILQTFEFCDYEKAKMLLNKKFKGQATSMKEKIKRRDYLIRRGFSCDISNRLVLRDNHIEN